ncbi:MAG: MFS transporter [Methyloceanibacter sp.]|jgi:MFS family permease
MDAAALERQGATPIGRKTAIRFIVLLGIVSLFGDMTYEGARSITGPYLGFLGASATIVGIVAGLGELLGYGVRLLSGWLGDRTQRYWAVMITGYALNLFAVPLLALTSRWELAAALIIAERMGRGIRAPVRDAALSHAAGHTGLGWGFGLHEAMDQTGAVIGPLAVSAALYLQYGYAAAFAILVVPAALSMASVLIARVLFPRPRDFDLTPPALQAGGFKRSYWIYMTAVALIGAGYVDFALIGFHFSQAAVVSPPLIPILFAVAMASDAVASLVLGHLFDRFGVIVLIAGASLAALASPLVFLGGETEAFLGMILWGIGMGIQESVMRAVVAGMTLPDHRATAFGILNAVFGVAWFLGSVALGVLYDQSVMAVALVSLTLQLLAIPFLLLIMDSGAGRRIVRQKSPGSSNTRPEA